MRSITRFSPALGLAFAALLIISCFLPWAAFTEPREAVFTGMKTVGTNLGRPGMLQIFFAAMIILFILIPRNWAKRFNLFFIAANMAWALRNMIIMSHCDGYYCPVRQYGLYLMLASSVLLALAVLFTEVKK